MPTSSSAVVVGLDLSKSSTGLGIGRLDLQTSGMRIERLATVKPHPAAKMNRWHRRAVSSVIANIEAEICNEPWFASREFTIAIEANVWGETSSEFQYYLGQETLHWGNTLGVDCMTYSPSTIKSFIKLFSAEDLGSLGGDEGKIAIERVWRLELRPRCPEAFPSTLLASNDAVDGGWIALFGLYVQAGQFARLTTSRTNSPVFWNGVDPVRDLFLKHKLPQAPNLGAVKMPNIFTNLRKNLHLGVAGKGFYPFRQMNELASFLRETYATDSNEVKRWCLQRVDGSWKSCRDLLESGSFNCGLRSSNGNILITP